MLPRIVYSKDGKLEHLSTSSHSFLGDSDPRGINFPTHRDWACLESSRVQQSQRLLRQDTRCGHALEVSVLYQPKVRRIVHCSSDENRKQAILMRCSANPGICYDGFLLQFLVWIIIVKYTSILSYLESAKGCYLCLLTMLKAILNKHTK